jgi:hypothetical protein
VPLVPTPLAGQLSGLSTDKLREWTSRRILVPADVRPKGKGSPAKFSWQTILVLRIAVLLRDQFNLELQAHKSSLDRLRKVLRSTSFIALWGQRLALRSDGTWLFLEAFDPAPEADVLLIRLDQHLRVLRDGFALPDAATQNGQMDLFSLPAIHGRIRPTRAAEVAVRRGRRRTS